MIYLDNNATTQPLPEVIEAMRACLEELYANPSSLHQFGQTVRHKLECARSQVASLLQSDPKEIVFTSGGTESINLAIRGGLRLHPQRRRFVTTAVEHPATLRVAEELEREGYEVRRVGVDRDGRLDEGEWKDAITADTALVSFLHANNETGVLFDVPRMAAVAAEHGVPVHVDAVQSAGKTPIDVRTWPVQLVSIAGHKFHGPKGVGALYVRKRTHLSPLIMGGRQERELRGGTENVEGIIGMGVAAEIAMRECDGIAKRVGAMRDEFERGVLAAVPYSRVSGAAAPRIYNTSNMSFEGLLSETILILLSEAGICASSGAACSSGSLEPSHVLLAMGLEDAISHSAIRFSLSKFTTREELNHVVQILPEIGAKLRKLNMVGTQGDMSG